MKKDKVLAFLKDEYKSIPLHFYDSVDSTQEIAKALAKDGAPHGCVVIAQEQTKGRGRGDKSFFSPKNTGIYFSIILKKSLLLPPAIYIAVATHKALKECGVEADIKWVNDLYIGGKKVCGILCNALCDGFIAGVGINVSTDAFPKEIENIAGSLESDIDKSALCAKVINNILDVMEQDSSLVLEYYRAYQMLKDKKISYTKNGEFYMAIAKGVDDNGHLIIERDGKTDTLSSGEVSIVKF